MACSKAQALCLCFTAVFPFSKIFQMEDHFQQTDWLDCWQK